MKRWRLPRRCIDRFLCPFFLSSLDLPKAACIMGSISYGSQEGTARTGWNLRWKSNDPPDSLLPQESINQCDLVCPLQLVPAALMMMSDCACRTEVHKETVSGHLCYLSVNPCPSLLCLVCVEDGPQQTKFPGFHSLCLRVTPVNGRD